METIEFEHPVARSILTRLRDAGTGLQGSDAERLFEPFWTTKEKGSGLGLAMSRRIIEDMGGTIHLANRQGIPGARVEVVLPLDLGN